jgi:hypothetical protein
MRYMLLKAGQRHAMDGPFAETKEALGGFYLIECDSQQEAVEWAKRIPLREGGPDPAATTSPDHG